MDWKAQLQQQLAEMTVAVWAMQNGLSEGTMPVGELCNNAEALNYRAGLILGHLSRWVLWNLEQWQNAPMPSHCADCGVYLMGGATEHREGCSFKQLIDQAMGGGPAGPEAAD